MCESLRHNQCMSSIGERVRQLREDRGLSQAELARRIGIKQPSLWLIEKGETRTVKVSTLEALCEALSTTKEFLLRGDDCHDSPESLELSAMESELIHILRTLPPDRRISLLEYARFIKSGTAPAPSKPQPGKVEPLKKKHGTY